ncbi:uncharacterized protein [Spinacia oleracea]|uniref:Uncharacterized protein isoform X2 n=1 Tax=Spinacia oleracea TaxID=3562 RepID=A0ABM3RCU7_SPIOL|nr:uncharacterized protein LOC110792869 isoform X2 [Spinacia oleracea]
MGDEKPQTVLCSIIAVETTNDFSYLVCSLCEKPLPNPLSLCKFCNRNSFNSSSASKRLFRLLVQFSPAFFDWQCYGVIVNLLRYFSSSQSCPSSYTTNAGKILEGEMCRMTLAKPKNGNAEHLRVTSVVPLSSGFQPVIQSLKELYGVH